MWKPALAFVLLSAITVAVLRQSRVRAWLVVGWVWFLGSLVPVIGIVQVGDQAMADRYTYLPLIGIFVIVVWGGAALFNSFSVHPVARRATVIVALGILCALTSHEITYWHDSISLWSRALQVTNGNQTAEQRLASALREHGDDDEALPHFLNSIRLNPKDLASRIDVGTYYGMHGHTQEAITEFQTVVALSERERLPHYRASAELNLGLAYAGAHDFSNALASFQEAYRSDPAMPDEVIGALQRGLAANPSEGGYLQQALLLRAKGQSEQAQAILQDASRSHPEYAGARELSDYLNSRTQ